MKDVEDISFPLSLRAWPPPQAEDRSLATQIQRIVEERKSLRNITEESLLGEIEAQEACDGEVKQETKDEDAGESEEDKKREDIYAVKTEMLQYLGYVIRSC